MAKNPDQKSNRNTVTLIMDQAAFTELMGLMKAASFFKWAGADVQARVTQAIGFDREKGEILVDPRRLMDLIRVLNPSQDPRPLRLATLVNGREEKAGPAKKPTMFLDISPQAVARVNKACRDGMDAVASAMLHGGAKEGTYSAKVLSPDEVRRRLTEKQTAKAEAEIHKKNPYEQFHDFVEKCLGRPLCLWEHVLLDLIKDNHSDRRAMAEDPLGQPLFKIVGCAEPVVAPMEISAAALLMHPRTLDYPASPETALVYRRHLQALRELNLDGYRWIMTDSYGALYATKQAPRVIGGKMALSICDKWTTCGEALRVAGEIIPWPNRYLIISVALNLARRLHFMPAEEKEDANRG